MIDIGEITVEQFLEIQKKRNETLQDFEENPFSLLNNEIEQLVIATGLDKKYFEKMNVVNELKPIVSDFHEQLKESNLKQFGKKNLIVVNKKAYFAETNMNEFTSSQYTDMMTFLEKGGIDENLDKMLALIFIPSKKYWLSKKEYDWNVHEAVTKDMRKAKLKDVIGTVFFYSDLLNLLIKASMESLKSANEKIQEVMPEVMKWAKENPEILKKAGLTLS